MAVGYLLFGILAGLLAALLAGEAWALGPVGMLATFVVAGNAAIVAAATAALAWRSLRPSLADRARRLPRT